MAKISLGKRPASFKHTVSIPVAGGEPDTLELTFRYRTRTELAQFSDEHNTASRARIDALMDRAGIPSSAAALKKKAKAPEAPAELPKPPGEADFAAAINQSHVEYILGACEGWELSDPFNAESVLQLVDRFPGAAGVIADAYNAAIKDGRQGN